MIQLPVLSILSIRNHLKYTIVFLDERVMMTNERVNIIFSFYVFSFYLLL